MASANRQAVNQERLNSFLGTHARRHGRHDERGAGGRRRPARPLQGTGRRRPDDRRDARAAHRHRRTLRPRMARGTGGLRLRHLRCRRRACSASSPSRRWCSPQEGSPAFLAGFFEIAEAAFRATPRIDQAFRTGRGVGWHEHHRCLFCGTERFFRPSYRHHLVTEWLPALEGVRGEARARRDGGRRRLRPRRLDDPDGAGVPASRFYGFDYHLPSIEAAREAAEAAGVADASSSRSRRPRNSPARDYDLVAFFDCLHDMGDPVGAAAHVHAALASDGTWMIVEPFAHDRLADNLNPVGRIYYAASTMICTPASMSQEVGLALGAQAGELRLREVVTGGGFTRFRRATETPFNLVLEARP